MSQYLHLEKSKWGSKKSFKELYDMALGNIELFPDPNVETYDTVFFFMLVDQDMMTTMKLEVVKPILIQVEVSLMKTIKAVPLKYDIPVYSLALHTCNQIDVSDTIFICSPMSIEEANEYMFWGHIDKKIKRRVHEKRNS